MNISITPELEKFVTEKVKSGMFGSASEVIRAALRLLAEHDEIRQKRKEALNREIQIGLDQLKRGEYITEAELKKHIKNRRKKFLS